MADSGIISLQAVPLTSERFADYGDVVETSLDKTDAMNEARFERFDDLCDIDLGDGNVAISVARCRTPTSLPGSAAASSGRVDSYGRTRSSACDS